MSERDTINDITSVKSPLRVELSEKLFNTLSEVLNDVHSTSFSVRFWKILLNGHVNAVISRIGLLETKDVFRTPDLIAINGFAFPSRKQKLKKSIIRFAKYIQFLTNKNRFIYNLKNSTELFIGFPENRALKKENLGAKLPKQDKLFIGRGENNKRKKVNNAAEQFDNVYMRNVVRELPKVLVEHFSNTYSSVPVTRPEDKTFHVHLLTTVFLQFVVARYVESGARLYWYQHGSEYGEFECYFAHSFSYSVSDQFRTWGWKIKENDVPWKAYRLEAFRERYNALSFDSSYRLLICYPEMNFKKSVVYQESSKELFSGLNKQKYDKILARPRRSNKLHSHASQISFIQDDRVDKSTGLKPMVQEMKLCDAVIQMNVPSTNFLECLYVDHPTLGVLRNDQPTAIVKPFYDFFKEHGVLHDNVESLIDHLNDIEISKWWRGLIDHPMYLAYKDTFAKDALKKIQN
jgi:putative transferase (TIGR04331 family)